MNWRLDADRRRLRPSGGAFVPWAIGWLFFASLTSSLPAPAQQTEEAPAAIGQAVPDASRDARPVDPYDPRVPAGAVRSYIDACRAGDYAKAARFLNLADVPEAERATAGPRLARQLKIVLDRALWIEFERLSADPAGRLDDDLPAELERVEGQGELRVLLERVRGADGERTWKFATSTVSRIPELYAEYGYGPLGELLPAAMFEVRLLEIQLWQWIGLLALAPVAYLFSWLGAGLIRAVARPIVARTRTELDDELLGRLLAPLTLIVALGLFTLGSLTLRLSVPVYRVLGGLEKAVAVLAITWMALRVVDILTARFDERLAAARRVAAIALLPLGRRAVKAVIIALALIAVLQNLGFHVTGLIAGLGVGGLAVALAAQKSIENLFGGVTIIADQPVRVGDFCRFGDKIGTIEEIGLRSTRIRTLDRTRITVPNSQFSEIHLENFALRDQVRLFTVLGLRYETTPDQLRYVLTELRKVLIQHPKVSNDPARVRFVSFGAHSLDLEVFAYVTTRDWGEFCAIREDLYLRFMDVVEASGSGFAFPSQTLYLGRDGGLDTELSRAAEGQVQRWREEGRLPFPDFSQRAVDEMDASSDYPPSGSVSARPAGERLPGDAES